jgi:glutamine amidotransferase
MREFFGHASENPDGWGYADFSHSPFTLAQAPERADNSPLAAQLLSDPLVVTCAFSHIRKATVGHIELENCHPFTGRDISGRQWTLAHKGTVFDSNLLDPYFHQQQGGTDSERILLYLIERVNAGTAEKGAPLNAEERFAVFESVTAQISPGNALALLVHDSDQLYLHANYRGALRTNHFSGGIVFCSSELTDDSVAFSRQNWEAVPLCQAFAFKQGKRCRIGNRHDGLYIPSDEDTRFLYQDYAAL